MLSGAIFLVMDKHQHLCLGISNNLGIDLTSAFQYAKYRNLTRSASTSLTLTDLEKINLGISQNIAQTSRYYSGYFTVPAS
ncbi:hypothetical protein C8R34_101146 [Nitrosomonas sp. Nm84]|nr:hypothetical protein C8R34_101146 [Nitrosomonas sp. Nm84]